MNRVSWVLYLVGSLLVFGSWMGLVTPVLGWFGWLAALAGWALGSFESRSRATCSSNPTPTNSSTSRVEALEKLALLHKEGLLSDEEFQAEKQRILRGY